MTGNVTLILVAITVITSIYGWNNQSIQQRWMFNPFVVHNGKQYYRFLSSGFIHSNTVHLLFNMIVLFSFGNVIERIYKDLYGNFGVILYLFTYLAGIVVSNIKTFVKYKDSSYYNSLGASGGVASILFATILYRPTSSICLYFAICIPAFILGALYLVYTYYSGKQSSDNINHDAHLYGSLFGIVFTTIIRPAVIVEFIERVKNFTFSEFQFL